MDGAGLRLHMNVLDYGVPAMIFLGIVMMPFFGLFMLAWQWLRPVVPPTTEEAREV
ncbi:hypothetical protein [Micromonospora matsumotoense]|uniref:hypothetical protein n=1 Tax=Micromonospora matsumotoense TaxID=121616 RepID=UPI00341162AF